MKNKLKENFSLAKLLGDGVFSIAKFYITSLFFPIERRLKINRINPIRLNLVYKSKKYTFFVKDSTDFAVLKEVFLMEEYKIHNNNIPNTILDLGSNIGASLVYFSILYPTAKIIGIEADPETFNLLTMNTKNFPNISILNNIISDKKGIEKFYIHPTSRLSSSSIERIPGQMSLDIEAMTILDVIKRYNLHGIDILKFDIEGGEFTVFENINRGENIKFLIGEVHEDLANKSVDQFLSKFSEYDMVRKEKIYSKRYIVELIKKND